MRRKQSAEFAVAAKRASGALLQQNKAFPGFGQPGLEFFQFGGGVCQFRVPSALRVHGAFLNLALPAARAVGSLRDLLGADEMGLGDPAFPPFKFGLQRVLRSFKGGFRPGYAFGQL